jgi:hypothetical protein
MNDLSYYPDPSKNPSFFSISMGVGLGNKNLNLPPMDLTLPEMFIDEDEPVTSDDEPLHLEFRSATVVGVEGAWFFNPYVGIGGRLRVKGTPIKGWNLFQQSEESGFDEVMKDPIFRSAQHDIDLTIESDHITEFAADAGIYFNLPLSSRFAIGAKLLVGRSVMDDIEIDAKFTGTKLNLNYERFFNEESLDNMFIATDEIVHNEWEYIYVHASNSMKYGTGLSLTYAHKNSFSWRLFCDYDYSRKTYTAYYNPLKFFEAMSPDFCEFLKLFDVDITQPLTSSARKHLHQWVLGGALCVSF